MVFLKAIFLGVVEGATEFIPVSSTGHLILMNEIMKLTSSKVFNDAFMIIIQLPAIVAVIAYSWKTLWPFGSSAQERDAIIVMWTKVATAFAPAAVIGSLLHRIIEESLFNSITVGSALLVGGIILILLERGGIRGYITSVSDIGYRTALFIGLFQCLAMIPGASRSAATIIGAMLLGAQRSTAVEFSFLLAIPTMLGATALTLRKMGPHFSHEEWALLVVGCVVSFVTAYMVIAAFTNYIRCHDFKPFGYYRIALGAIVLGYFLIQNS